MSITRETNLGRIVAAETMEEMRQLTGAIVPQIKAIADNAVQQAQDAHRLSIAANDAAQQASTSATNALLIMPSLHFRRDTSITVSGINNSIRRAVIRNIGNSTEFEVVVGVTQLIAGTLRTLTIHLPTALSGNNTFVYALPETRYPHQYHIGYTNRGSTLTEIHIQPQAPAQLLILNVKLTSVPVF